MAGIGSNKLRRRRGRARLVFFLLLFVSVILFFASQSDEDILAKTRSSSESPASRVMSIVTLPVRGFENFMADQRERSRAHSENKRLRTELARLSDIEARANALSIKLSGLENILNVDVSSGIPEERIAARAVVENGGPFVRSVLLNAGASAGIEVGHPVMTADGLLGHVIRVGNSSSRVLHLEDLNSRIPVMSLRSQSRAILTGDNSNFPKLSFMTEGSDWTEGDVVMTSGDGGTLPSGLPIGYVKQSDEGELFVVLYVNDHHVDWVWIYPHDPIAKPENDPVREAAITEEEIAEAAESEAADATLSQPDVDVPAPDEPVDEGTQ